MSTYKLNIIFYISKKYIIFIFKILIFIYNLFNIITYFIINKLILKINKKNIFEDLLKWNIQMN